MLKHLLHILFSALLAVVLLFGNTAKEFIHLFADHEDTAHCSSPGKGLAFEKEHHHCDFLSFSLPPYVGQDAALPLRREESEYHQFTSALAFAEFTKVSLTPSFRGPPALA